MMKPCFFVTCNIIMSHIFPETFIEIPEIFQKIWRMTNQYLLFIKSGLNNRLKIFVTWV